jgi:hypothetical protein
MKSFFIWMQKDEGWKTILAVIYAVICIFDFIIVPSWIGMTRRDLDMSILTNLKLDVQVQLELIKAVYQQHEPFTLQGGGLFHLAFGALLTGSAISRIKGDS